MLLMLLFACSNEPLEADLVDAVRVEALLDHLDELQAIADAHGGNRAAVTEGYAQSATYVADALEDAGYAVTLEEFVVSSYVVNDALVEEVGGAELEDFTVLAFSGSGEVTAELVPVDVVLPPPAEADSVTSGCEATDFDAFPEGAIALIQRGSCTFAAKVAHAEAAGATAVVIFNEGQPGRTEPVQGVLDEEAPATIPVIGVGFATGAAWAEEPVTLHVTVTASVEEDLDHNVLAETPGGDAGRVVLVGAHLDSVPEGPGINDNGSGSALVLETAIQVALSGLEPRNRLRFAFWGAEEGGLIGSFHHVHDEATGDPDPATTADLVAVLNYDMLASGNGYRFVYDGDGSSFGDVGVSPASEEIEDLYREFLDQADQGAGETPLLLPSDSYWFAGLGIPTGGLFSGASGIKTEAMAEEVGGVAGEPLDPCYHQACDRIDAIDPTLYAELAAAGVHVVAALADDAVDLGRGRAVRDLPRPRGCHAQIHWDR